MSIKSKIFATCGSAALVGLGTVAIMAPQAMAVESFADLTNGASETITAARTAAILVGLAAAGLCIAMVILGFVVVKVAGAIYGRWKGRGGRRRG